MIDIPNSVVPKRMPHVFSRLDSETRANYISRYKTLKRTGVAASIGAVTVSGVIVLAKDIAASKLKAYGYRILFSLISGPIIQIVGLPFYIYSYSMHFRKYAIAVMQVGAQISRGEFELAGLAWFIADFSLFGEFIPITDDIDFCLVHNETGNAIQIAFNNTLDNIRE